jgi:secreted trypsin-like serine protease
LGTGTTGAEGLICRHAARHAGAPRAGIEEREFMRRTLLALASAALLAISIVAPATAITGNYVEDFDHPFVGLVAFYSDNRGTDAAFVHRCSGSLLDDGTPADGSRVFLTAGHCTDNGAGGVNVSARVWFRQDAGARFDGVNRDPLTGYPDKCIDDRTFELDACETAHEMYNFGFDNFAGFPNTLDAGIVILDKPVVLPEYATVADAGTIDTIDTSKGNTTLTVSGYGITNGSNEAAAPLSFRERLMATTTIVNTTSSWNDGFNVQTQGSGGSRGGTCSGDSGGPVFYPSDTNQIVAVTSFGKNNPNACVGTDYAYRVDRAEVIDWIDEVSGSYWNP